MSVTSACDGKCERHSGEIVLVSIKYKDRDWGEFMYCEAAIKEDRGDGFIVTEMKGGKECEHCWHLTPLQHAITNHECQVCCHCGDDRCIHLKTQPIPEGHGKYYPTSEPNVILEAAQ